MVANDATSSTPKEPFDLETVLRRVGEAVRHHRKAALFELAEIGHDSPFEVLIACIISIRTRDETTVPSARQLFALGRTPEQLAKRSVEAIDDAISACTFHEAKAKQIRDIAQRVVREHAGELPCDYDTLTSFHGVGPKCAHLTLGLACGEPVGVGVDVHVHRVTNRWGYVQTRSPEQTMRVLHERLPREHWVRLNALLVPFGKHICTGRAPHCSTCPVLTMCRQVGVGEHR